MTNWNRVYIFYRLGMSDLIVGFDVHIPEALFDSNAIKHCNKVVKFYRQ